MLHRLPSNGRTGTCLHEINCLPFCGRLLLTYEVVCFLSLTSRALDGSSRSKRTARRIGGVRVVGERNSSIRHDAIPIEFRRDSYCCHLRAVHIDHWEGVEGPVVGIAGIGTRRLTRHEQGERCIIKISCFLNSFTQTHGKSSDPNERMWVCKRCLLWPESLVRRGVYVPLK